MLVERSFLFVPADRLERFAKALATQADRIIIDLEDAVAPEAKAAARDSLVNWLEGAQASNVMVRVNAITTPRHDDDIQAIASLARVVGLMLLKAESVEAIARTRAKLSPKKSLVGLLETVRGRRRPARGRGNVGFVTACVRHSGFLPRDRHRGSGTGTRA
jgi:citrate lyase subunit beta/citryl-CoA lyase